MKTNLNTAFLSSICFRMIDDSMDNDSRWCFADGDYLGCDEVKIEDIEIGRDYVIKSDDSYLVRRVTSTDGESVTLSPLNLAYEECIMPMSDIQQAFIVRTFRRQVAEETDLQY